MDKLEYLALGCHNLNNLKMLKSTLSIYHWFSSIRSIDISPQIFIVLLNQQMFKPDKSFAFERQYCAFGTIKREFFIASSNAEIYIQLLQFFFFYIHLEITVAHVLFIQSCGFYFTFFRFMSNL